MPTPKFRQFASISTDELRALATVDQSAIARARIFLATLSRGGQAVDIRGKRVAVRASDVRALFAGERFRFDKKNARWLNRGGGVVPEATIKASAEAMVSNSSARIATLYDALRTGELSGTQWQREFQSALSDNFIGNAALSHGTFDLPPPVRERLSQRLFEQFNGNEKFPGLRGFVHDLERGRYGQSELSNAANARGLLYPQSGRIVYENEYAAAKGDAGFTLVARLLANVKHCESCIEEAAKGFVPQDEAVPIGGDLCGPGCHCSQIFKREGEEHGPEAEKAIERAQSALADLRGEQTDE